MTQAIGPRCAVCAIVLAVVSALLVFAPGAFADDETVSITNSGFSPMSVSITPGDTVTWQNNSSSSCAINFLVSGPAAPATISPGGSGSATFAIAGTYQYICTGVTANVGTIIVETVATATPTGTLTPTATMTNTPTSTVTATATGSATPTSTATLTPTTTPTRTPTLTPTATRTATIAPATAVPTPRPPATGAGEKPGSPAAWLVGLGLLAIAGGLGAVALRQSGSRRA